MSLIAKYRASSPAAPSAALAKVIAEREAIYAPENALRIVSPDNKEVVFFYEDDKGRPCARGFRGRAKKPAFSYYFVSVERREDFVEDWLASAAKSKAAKAEKAKKVRNLEVGDVLYSSWGYEQTNIDFYVVTALVGKSSVKVAEIAQEREYQGDMHGKCVPVPSKIIGEEFTKRVDGDRIRLNSFSSAGKLEYQEVEGLRVYRSLSWSSWA